MPAAVLAPGTFATWNGLDVLVIGFATPGRVYVRLGNMMYSAPHGDVWSRGCQYNWQVAAQARRAA